MAEVEVPLVDEAPLCELEFDVELVSPVELSEDPEVPVSELPVFEESEVPDELESLEL